MREIKKYKEVKVRCFKTGQNLFSEIFQNITEKKLEEELNKMVQAGWDRFDIDTDGKKRTLVLKKTRKYSQQTGVHNKEKKRVKSYRKGANIASEPVKSRISPDKCIASDPIAKELSGTKDWKQLAIEHREKKEKRKK